MDEPYVSKYETIAFIDDDPDDKLVLVITIERNLNDKHFDALTRMRAAARDFLSTDAGKQEIKANNGYFNWGDFAASVPGWICRKYGFSIRETTVATAVANHDESLIIANDESLTPED